MSIIDLDSLDRIPLSELEYLAYRLQINYTPPLSESDRERIIEQIVLLYSKYQAVIDIEELKREIHQARKEKLGECNDETTLVGDDVDLLGDMELVYIPMRDTPGKFWCFDRVQDVPNLIRDGFNPFTREKWNKEEMRILRKSKKVHYPKLSEQDLERQEINKVYEDLFQGRKQETRVVDILQVKTEELENRIRPENPYAADALSTILSSFNLENLQFLLHHISWYKKLTSTDLRDAKIETVDHLIKWYDTRPDKTVAGHEMGLVLQEVYEMVRDKLSLQEYKTRKEQEGDRVIYTPDEETRIKYWSNGNKKSKCQYKNGKKDGKCKKWYKNGNVKEIIFYKKGKRDGEYKKLYKYGNVKIHCFYKKDNLEGEYKEWYENSHKIMKKCFYKNGLLDGEFDYWYENGNKRMHSFYINGKSDGISESWYKDNTISSIHSYKNGILDGEYKTFYKNGNIREHGYYKNRKLDGEYKELYENGDIIKHCFYKDGLLDGEYKEMNENGDIIKHCFYKVGVLDGEYKEMYENGDIKIHCFYKNDLPDGIYEYWYKNERLKFRCSYKRGLLNGEYREMYKNGNVKEIIFYKNGNKDGEYKSWYDNEQLKKHCFYKNDKIDGECDRWNRDGTKRE